MREVLEIRQSPRGYTRTGNDLNLNNTREKQNKTKQKMVVNALVCTAKMSTHE
jgi:hypothetical protein